jgi:hypothetical protein
MARTYIHHTTTTIHVLLYTSSILPGQAGCPLFPLSVTKTNLSSSLQSLKCVEYQNEFLSAFEINNISSFCPGGGNIFRDMLFH